MIGCTFKPQVIDLSHVEGRHIRDEGKHKQGSKSHRDSTYAYIN